jgi:hypothetical protein
VAYVYPYQFSLYDFILYGAFVMMIWNYVALFLLGGLSALAGAGVIPIPKPEVKT